MLKKKQIKKKYIFNMIWKKYINFKRVSPFYLVKL